MKNLNKILLLSLISSMLFCSCGGDGGETIEEPQIPYNPYANQAQTPFYPTGIIIEKKNDNTEYSEKWTISYESANKIKHYTKKSVERFSSEGRTKTIEESGSLSYYNNKITNTVTVTTTVNSNGSEEQTTKEITEIANINNGHIDCIEQLIKSNGSNSTHTRTFAYNDDNKCTSSNEKSDENPSYEISYTYNWDENHNISSIEVYDKSNTNWINRVYNYSYGELSANYDFQVNAFLYDNYPTIYAAMGLLGKTSPYAIHSESQSIKVLRDGKWDETSNADRRTFTLIPNDNSLMFYVESNNYSTNYFIKFTR